MARLGKGRFQRGMGDLVTEMGEVTGSRRDGRCGLQGLRNRHMRGMGSLPEGVEHKDFHAARRLDGFRGNLGAIGEIGQQPASPAQENKTGRGESPVRQIDRDNLGLPEAERTVDHLGGETQVVLPGLRLVEGVAEGVPEPLHRGRRRKDGHLQILEFAEAPHVVEPHDVIGVGMGDQRGIEPGDPFPEALAPEIGRGVDDKVAVGCLHQKGGPRPVIARVGRLADRASATDHGDAVGCPGSEKGEIERRHDFSAKDKGVILRAMPAMLRSLRIRNLALVETLEWDLSPGFTAVTGETGAGKSVILGALKFLLGERADRGVVRSGASNAGIEAVFTLDDTAGIDALLEESGIDPCQDGELILKRTIAAEGSGRQFVNGSACNLSVLKELGTLLVDLHGPHDHQSLFSRSEQTLLLDRFSEALREREAYLARRADLAKEQRDLEELLAISGGEERVARLRGEVEEIRAANLSEGEEEALASRYRAASDSRRLIELASAAVARLEDEEHGVLSGIAETARLLKDLGRLDERAQPYLDGMERISMDLHALVSDLRDHAEAIELDAAELRNLEERVNLLATLRRKYGPSMAEVIARGEHSAAEMERLSNLTEETGKAGQRVSEARRQLQQAADALGSKRKKGLKKLSALVAGELSDLGFRQAGFEISLEVLAEPGADGAEIAEFLFSPNPGEPPRPLRSIASSGEISRVMLALKTALAGQDRIPLLVFDEIDANVGGEIATRVAVKMAELGRGHQVLCITHLPQVAAAASAQFLVSKEIRNSRTETTLLPVEGEDRVAEIARMLGGASESALAHAKTLLSEGSPAQTPRRSRS